MVLVQCVVCLCTLNIHADGSSKNQESLDDSLRAFQKFFETSPSLKFTSKIHQKILHSGHVTRDEHYYFQTTLSKKPRGLYRELTKEGTPFMQKYWNGGKEIWFFDVRNKVALKNKVRGKPTATIGILDKISLQKTGRFLPHGLLLWESLFFDSNLNKVFSELKKHAQYEGEESVHSQPCWVINIPYQLGNPDPPSTEYATHVFSKIWIRKTDGAPIRCVFDQVASAGVWQMHNNLAADFLDIQVGIAVEDSTFDFNMSDEISLLSPKRTPLPLNTKAPDFQLTDLSGNTKNLYDYESELIILSFTAPTCSNCRAIYPHLQRIADKYGKRVSILPLYWDDTPEVMKSYFASQKLSMTPLRIDWLVRLNLYNIPHTPVTYILDRNKKILKVFDGYPNDADPKSPPKDYDIYQYVESTLKK